MADGKLTSDKKSSSSQVAAIAGVHPYSEPNDALNSCLDAIEGKPRKEIKMTPRIMWGNRSERDSMEMGLELLDLPINDIVFQWTFDKPFHHPTLPLSCSLDGLYNVGHKRFPVRTDTDKNIYTPNGDTLYLRGQGIVENKMTGSFPDADGVLPEWRGKMQAATACEILGLSWFMVVVNYQNEPYVYVFERDPKFAQFLSDLILDFDRRIREKDYYPPWTSSGFNLVYPNSSETTIELNKSAEQAGKDILAAKKMIKDCKAIIEKSEMIVKEQMGENQHGSVGRFIFSWKNRTYKAQPEKWIEAKPERIIRQSNITIKELSYD